MDSQSVINWTVVQLSWQYPRAPTLDHCSDHCSISQRSSSSVYSTARFCRAGQLATADTCFTSMNRSTNSTLPSDLSTRRPWAALPSRFTSTTSRARGEWDMTTANRRRPLQRSATQLWDPSSSPVCGNYVITEPGAATVTSDSDAQVCSTSNTRELIVVVKYYYVC